jgi:hypothetical protein
VGPHREDQVFLDDLHLDSLLCQGLDQGTQVIQVVREPVKGGCHRSHPYGSCQDETQDFPKVCLEAELQILFGQPFRWCLTPG